MKNLIKMTVAGVSAMMLTACNGIFDDIYDQPQEIIPAKGQIVLEPLVLCRPETVTSTHGGW